MRADTPPRSCPLLTLDTAVWSWAGFVEGEHGTTGQYEIHFRSRVELLKTSPERLSARRSIALSSEITTHSSNHADGFSDGRRLLRWHRTFGGIATEGFPFISREEDGAGQVG